MTTPEDVYDLPASAWARIAELVEETEATPFSVETRAAVLRVMMAPTNYEVTTSSA